VASVIKFLKLVVHAGLNIDPIAVVLVAMTKHVIDQLPREPGWTWDLIEIRRIAGPRIGVKGLDQRAWRLHRIPVNIPGKR
jgi:hypothetical protein